ncbi:MAG TPA: NUDIX domain-containing protein [Caldithrix abyssi]|uniref:NUDIX domain-containing protein n=1 Tax=Caldithrix abyssi TaxID=187145 RepID=A0A7V5H5F4_CALAY|nr:NUDIX hydrolase [Caldisericaceae bacterium]HHE55820.1 NUDIX domain-containing protein [Caldithrix abyssi]
MKVQQCPQIGVGAVVFKDNKILLVKRKNPPAKNQWAIPGGRLQLGETLREACQREILEETGINIKVGELIYTFEVIERRADGQILFHYVILDFLADYLSGTAIPGDDAIEVGWFSPQDIKSLDINLYTKKLLKEKLHFYRKGA